MSTYQEGKLSRWKNLSFFEVLLSVHLMAIFRGVMNKTLNFETFLRKPLLK